MGQTNTSGPVEVWGTVDFGDSISGPSSSSGAIQLGEEVVGSGTAHSGGHISGSTGAGTAIDTTCSGYIDLTVSEPTIFLGDSGAFVSATGGGLTISALLIHLATEEVFAGGTSIDTMLTTSTLEVIHSGGTAVGTVVNDAKMVVDSAGFAGATVVNAKGLEFVFGLAGNAAVLRRASA